MFLTIKITRYLHIGQITLEKPEETTNNGQCRETDKVENTRQTKQKLNTEN